MVLLTGRAGAGRTTVLAAVGEALRGQRRTVIDVRVARDGILLVDGATGTTGAEPGPFPLTRVDGARAAPALARRAAAGVAASLVPRGAVVLIDDGQWMTPDAAAVLEALGPQLAGTAVRCVCAVSLPCPKPLAASGSAALQRLRAEGLAAVERIPILDADATAQTVRALLGAVPSPELVAHVRARSRGIPGAAVDVVASLRRANGVHLVSGHAHLVPDVLEEPGAGRSLLKNVRRLGRGAWRTACTAAALEPAGSALPALLATALEMPLHDALAHLHDLEAAGVLHHARDGGWRFLVPVVRDRLRAVLGPYERRMLAALVVQAVWRGESTLPRPELADLVATAGRLLPAERAHAELVVAAEVTPHRGAFHRHARWWGAAAGLAANEEDRVRAGLEHARACERAGEPRATIAAVYGLLEDGAALPEGVRDELMFMLVLGLHRNGETEQVDAVADGTARSEGDDAILIIRRAVALALRGRFGAGSALLARTCSTWAARPVTRELGEMLLWVAEVCGGQLRPEVGLVLDGPPEGADPVRRRDRVDWTIACLLALGDVHGTRDRLRQDEIADTDLFPPHRAVLALLEGRPEADELARRAVADRNGSGLGLSHGDFHRMFAGLSLARGQLNAARQQIEAARTEVPPLDHVLEVSAASMDLALGDIDAASARLGAALTRARDNGLVVGTDLLLSLLIEIDRLGGDDSRARARARELDEVAAALQSPRASMHAAFGRALAHADDAAAADCMRLARESGQVYEAAHLKLQLASAGLTDPAVLLEVHGFYGRFDAMLARSWTRSAMKERGVPIQGREATKNENERLLGQLLTEGLTNRQIATLLGSSERSVEGRLGRLLSRTGYRSRIELAAALLAAPPPAPPSRAPETAMTFTCPSL
jgi:DNA-binding CsgD family transcriptional regulator